MKLLVVGWDAATQRHLAEFDLPFWESLSHQGQLLPEYPFDRAGYISSANAWTTISTGASFFDHGLLGFVYGKYSGHPLSGIVQKIATQEKLPPLLRRILIGRVLGKLGAGEKGEKGKKVDSTDIEYKRVWEYLDGEGLIYGLPLTYPTWETNGTVVSGIPAPNPEEATYPVVYPEEIQEFVYDGSGTGYYVEMNSPVNDSSIEERPYCDAHQDRMKANAEKYAELYDRLSSDRPIEFGFLMLRALDDIMHATKNKDILRESYKIIDKVTESVVETVDPDATLILSDHGMRPCSAYRFDKAMRMDHDTTQGVWGATEPLGLERHTDVTPAILRQMGLDAEPPEKRKTLNTMTSEGDRKTVHEHLKDLGYA